MCNQYNDDGTCIVCVICTVVWCELEGCMGLIGFGASRGTPNQKSRGRYAGVYFVVGWSGRSENFVGDPGGTGELWDLRCVWNEVNATTWEEIKAGCLLDKRKHGKSDIWKHFSLSLEKKKGDVLNLLVSCDKCAKVFVYNEHKSDTSALRRHTYFLSSMCLFI